MVIAKDTALLKRKIKSKTTSNVKKLILIMRRRYTNHMTHLLKKSFLPLIALVLLVFLGLQINHQSSAPNVVFTTIDGVKIPMASLKGKVVLVNFWATDCASCIKEMPQLTSTYNQFNQKGFAVIAVAMPYDPPEQVLNYVKQKKPPFPVMHDGLSEMSQKFGDVNVTPTTLIYNKQGFLVQRTLGILDFNALEQLLEKELNTKKGTANALG